MITDEGEHALLGEQPEPYARPAGGNFRLSLNSSVREVSDVLVVSLRCDGDCIRVSDVSTQLREGLMEIPLAA